jgi:hypothetical protein
VTVSGKGKGKKNSTVGEYIPFGPTAADATSYRDVNADFSSTYRYRVKARHNAVGDSAYSNEADAKTK